MSNMDHVLNSDKIALAPMLDFLNHTTEAKVNDPSSLLIKAFLVD